MAQVLPSSGHEEGHPLFHHQVWEQAATRPQTTTSGLVGRWPRERKNVSGSSRLFVGLEGYQHGIKWKAPWDPAATDCEGRFFPLELDPDTWTCEETSWSYASVVDPLFFLEIDRPQRLSGISPSCD